MQDVTDSIKSTLVMLYYIIPGMEDELVNEFIHFHTLAQKTL